MIPKEKAFELFNKYYQYDITIIGTESEFEERGIGLSDAKKLASIAVDEIIKYLTFVEITGTIRTYWLDVREEIEKL